jgi:hypothetical protein
VYPPEIHFPEKEIPGVIRVKVAAICVMLDHGSYNETEFSEEEISPFVDDVERVSSDGKRHDVWLKPHAFINVEPTGYFAGAVKKVIAAIGESIVRREILPVRLSVNLDGEIDAKETWLRLSDVEDWCRCRNLDTGELFGQYWDDEQRIFEGMGEAGDVARMECETQNFDAELETISSNAKWDENMMEQYSKLMRENFVLRSTKSHARTAERPIATKERKTLLAIIAALCKDAGYDYTKHAKTAGLIQSTADKMGISIGETTIEGHLKKIPDTLATRMK